MIKEKQIDNFKAYLEVDGELQEIKNTESREINPKMKYYLISYFYILNLDKTGLRYKPVESYGDIIVEAKNKLSPSDIEILREKIKHDNEFERVVILNIIELAEEE